MIESGSNRRPQPCKGCVITTTLRKKAKYLSKMIFPYLKSRLFWHYFWNSGLPRFVLSRLLFRWMVRNGIPTVCFFICSKERNSELFSFRWRVRKGILRVCFYLCFHGTEFRVVFSSAEGFGTEFRGFLFRGTDGIPSEITFCSVYSVFRGIIFLSEIPNPTRTLVESRLETRRKHRGRE